MLLLGAQLPAYVPYWQERPETRRMIEDLERVGFGLELRTDGLALQGRPDELKALREQPDRLAIVAPVAVTFGRLAHHLRAEPPRAG